MHCPLLATLACILLLAAFALRYGSRPESPLAEAPQTRVASSPDGARQASEEVGGDSSERRFSALDAPAPLLDLRSSLIPLAQLELGDEAGANKLLRPLLLDPRLVREALRLLASGALKTHPDVLSAEEIGAIRLVWFAVAVYNTDELSEELEAAGFQIDARAFTEEVLRALADIEDPAATTLAQLLATLSVDGRQVIDTSYLELLRVLIATYADREDVYAILLVHVGQDEDIEFDFQFLDPKENPKVLAGRLITAFEKADPTQALQILQWIEQNYEGAGDELRDALAGAVAAGAPVPLAAAFLAERATSTMHAQLDTLGARPGGPESLAVEYNRLIATGGSDAERTMLVFGMSRAGTELMLGIAKTDPHPGVRGQAFVSATLAPNFVPSADFLAELRAAHALSGPHHGAPPYAILSSAHNLLLRAGRSQDPVLRKETVAFLLELASDPSLSPHDRARLPGILEAYLDPAQREQLAATLEAHAPR